MLLIEPSPGQQHVVIIETAKTVIHAHAGLRRVVREKMALDQEILAHWRLNDKPERKA